MIVYEFYIKENFRKQLFEEFCESFYKMGSGKRQIDELDDSYIFAVSRNPKTGWVQLLVDENAPSTFLSSLEAKLGNLVDSLKQRRFSRFLQKNNLEAPTEKPRNSVDF